MESPTIFQFTSSHWIFPAGRFFLLLAIVTQPGLSLRCYTCNSKDDISCWNLTSSPRDIPVKVSECPKEGMDCMQKIGIIVSCTVLHDITCILLDKNNDTLVVFRECSHRTFPDKCNDDQVTGVWRGRD